MRSEKTLYRDELEGLLVASGLDPKNVLIAEELAAATLADGLVIVNTAKRDSLLTKVCGRIPHRSA
jgi:hypothetical protein